jgi:hypothetical protein
MEMECLSHFLLGYHGPEWPDAVLVRDSNAANNRYLGIDYIANLGSWASIRAFDPRRTMTFLKSNPSHGMRIVTQRLFSDVLSQHIKSAG